MVVVVVALAPVVGTLDFVSLRIALRSAATRSMDLPSWSQMTDWFGHSFHSSETIILAPNVVEPAGNR